MLPDRKRFIKASRSEPILFTLPTAFGHEHFQKKCIDWNSVSCVQLSTSGLRQILHDFLHLTLSIHQQPGFDAARLNLMHYTHTHGIAHIVSGAAAGAPALLCECVCGCIKVVHPIS
jgi:hypothetical protein